MAPGYDLIALGGYYHTLSMEDDPLEVKGWMDELGLKPSAVSAHSPLMRPEVSVPYLTQAIRYASDLGAPVVTTDEGTKPDSRRKLNVSMRINQKPSRTHTRRT